jgi:flagellar basal-body rod modification protein FlgD
MIDPTLAASAVATGLDLLRGAEEEAKPKANDAVDRNDFLTLLITQLQNQDPLNPLDSANFSAQLAQFSALEQLTQINGKLTGQTDGGTASRFEILSLLGNDVRGDGSTITVAQGTSSALEFEMPAAGTVRAQVVDANGREVANLDLGVLPAGEHTLELTGVDGAPTLNDGTYRVLLTRSDGSTAVPLGTTVSGRVTGVDLSTDPPTLLLGDTRLALEDVTEIREPAPATTP